MGESLNYLIRDINVREAFTVKYNIGGQVDNARNKVSAATTYSAEEARDSTRISEQPNKGAQPPREHSIGKGK